METTMNPKALPLKLPKTTSRAKMTPAMGALKVPLMPAAAPQATNRRTSSGGWRPSCPRMLPKVAPIWTMGPSRPTEPPVPMQRALAKIFTKATLGPDLAPLLAHRVLDLRHPVALGLDGPTVDDVGNGRNAKGGNQDDVPAPPHLG